MSEFRDELRKIVEAPVRDLPDPTATLAYEAQRDGARKAAASENAAKLKPLRFGGTGRKARGRPRKA